jgi:hypothetical protein
MDTTSFLRKYGFRSINASQNKWVLGVFYISFEKPISDPKGRTLILRKNLTKKVSPSDKISNCLYKGAYIFDNEELVKWLFYKIGITHYSDSLDTNGRLSHHKNLDFYNDTDHSYIKKTF